jgi:hypothetical protein
MLSLTKVVLSKKSVQITIARGFRQHLQCLKKTPSISVKVRVRVRARATARVRDRVRDRVRVRVRVRG